jgi:hypothetical protein
MARWRTSTACATGRQASSGTSPARTRSTRRCDVIVSCLRVYSGPELRDLTAGLGRYQWDIGTVRGKGIPIPLSYLIGVPAEKAAAPGTSLGEGGASD